MAALEVVLLRIDPTSDVGQPMATLNLGLLLRRITDETLGMWSVGRSGFDSNICRSTSYTTGKNLQGTNDDNQHSAPRC